MLRLAVPLAILIAAAPSLAQESSPDAPDSPQADSATSAKDVKIRRYLEVSGRGALGELLLEDTLVQIAEMPMPEGFADAIRERARPETLLDRLIPAYRDLDDATLDAAIAFYQTDAGKRLAAAQAELDTATQRVAGEWMQEAAQAAMKALGMPTPAENLAEARRNGNEAAALGAMRTVNTAQALFREADKDRNDQYDYAHNLAQLGKVQLIDAVLASGEKQGYRFELCTGSQAPEFLWMLVAHPIEPGVSGTRWFVTNQSGVIFYSTEGPFELDRVECQIPDGATPVGR